MTKQKLGQIVIVMLTCNQRETTLRCLNSIRENYDDQVAVVVWDNGSTDGTLEAIASAFPSVQVHRHEHNLGAAAGRNCAAKLAIDRFSPEFLVFLDNDTVVTTGFIEAMNGPFQSDDQLAITSPKIRLLRDPSRMNCAGGSRIRFWLGDTTSVGSNQIDAGQFDASVPCIAPTTAMMVRVDMFQRVNGFDTEFDPYGYEDLDFSLRINQIGGYGLYVPDALIFHDPSQTFESGQYSASYARRKKINWLLFMRRHAPFPQRIGFYLFGMPYRLARVVWREGRKGNLAALRGVLPNVRRRKP